ncbi:MAG: glycoside hydrolase family 116 protein, partial [Defluviitaleaceae bacterium]|nr:glycoside hydrolase family 116 protein [Defluviitaleaceae bacterium]
NYYATIWKDSGESAAYSLRMFDVLYERTNLFRQTLYESTLPPAVIDAVSANLSVIKSPTCLRLSDGSLYGFEGCFCDGGCCEGSCTHVWSYTYAIPFLFPKLERSMRTNEYAYSMNDDGSMGFRLMLPLGRKAWDFRPCVDGQYGTVMRVLREYKISGDKNWLVSIWNGVKRSVSYAWSEANADKWDANKDGIMEGRQHHTLDMELFGENAWLSGMYLGGLAAGAELAEIVGDTDARDEFKSVYSSGVRILNDRLYNGRYFFHDIDIKDKTMLDRFSSDGSMIGGDVYSSYWNGERGELKYQIGDGCGIDQMLAQWHANLIGLGRIFDKEKTRTALESVYRHNFIKDMRAHVNPCRVYCLNDERGLIIASYPEESVKPAIPAPYSEETMNGFEYQAAALMIQEGMEEEGLECVEAVRERYDGRRRNPWNEFECGSNYARSMASYSLLLAYSGFKYDAALCYIGFDPLNRENGFKCFWSLDGCWGRVEYGEKSVTIELLFGEIELSRVSTGIKKPPLKVIADGSDTAFDSGGDLHICLNEPKRVKKSLEIRY